MKRQILDHEAEIQRDDLITELNGIAALISAYAAQHESGAYTRLTDEGACFALYAIESHIERITADLHELEREDARGGEHGTDLYGN